MDLYPQSQNSNQLQNTAASGHSDSDTLSKIFKGDFKAWQNEHGSEQALLKAISEKLKTGATHDLRSAVALAVSITNQLISAAKLTRDVQEVDSRAQTIAAASDELVASISSIFSSSEMAVREMEAVDQAARKGLSASNQARTSMNDIANAVNETAERVEKLNEASKAIGVIVNQIEDIASQTNLLALNATIEAARAGEAGRGFSVVASEVKSLANQTANATVDIRNRIARLQADMSQISESMHAGAAAVASGEGVIAEAAHEIADVSKKVDSTKNIINEVRNILNEQKLATNEIATGISEISKVTTNNKQQVNALVDQANETERLMSAELNTLIEMDIPKKTIMIAKSDHMIWRKRLASMVIGRETLDPNELADHNSCRLGKWYNSVQDPQVRNNPAFQRLVEPHRAVHAHGIEAARKYKGGDLNGALAEIEKVALHSKEVMRLLDELMQN